VSAFGGEKIAGFLLDRDMLEEARGGTTGKPSIH